MRAHLFIANLVCILWIQTCIAQKNEIFSRPYHSSIKKGTIKNYLDELNSGGELVVEYSSNSLQLQNIVELDGSETSLGLLLQKILSGQHVKLLEKNNKIILAASLTPINTDNLVASYNLFGFVKEDMSKEPMIDATIIDLNNQKIIVSNSFGYYSLSLREGNHRIKISYSGFDTKTIDVSLHKDMRLDFELSMKSDLPVVTVTSGGLLKKNVSDTETDDANNYFLGENDPLRSICLLPGVSNMYQNFSNMQVRGGGQGENLFLLDGTQVYNPTHLLGALSIVNETVLKNLRLYKSDFPAKFSGSLSSVIDVYTKDGNMNYWEGEANLGILSGAFSLGGPIIKNKTALMVSFRHSWVNSFWGQFEKNLNPSFYDIDTKITQLISKGDKLILNFYTGHDKINETGTNINNLHQWENILGSLRWSHLLGAKSFIYTSIDFSQYQDLGGFKFSLLNDNEDTVQTKSVGMFSSIEQYNAKLQGELYASGKTKFNTGVQFNQTFVKPFESKTTAQLTDNTEIFTAFKPLPFEILAAYAEMEYKPNHHFIIRPGTHLSYYQFDGYQYFSFQPRFYTAFQFNDNHQVFVAFNKMTQYLHFVTNPYLGLNADIWVPSTAILKPEESESYTLGYEFRTNKKFIFSLSAYWKLLHNVTNYKNGKSYFINDTSWQQNIESGNGSGYGIESMLQWSPNRFSIRLSYTLSWSWRQFADINNGIQFPYKYDSRHVFNIAIAYHLGKSIDVYGSFSFSSGEAVLQPGIIYPAAQQNNGEDDISENYQFNYQYADTNQYRSVPYYRINFGLRYHSSMEKRIQSIITAGVYNIGGARDQYAYDLLGSLNSKDLIAQTNRTAYNFFPYISYTLKF